MSPVIEKPNPDALLLIAPDCPHCPVVLQSLSQLVKAGTIGRLEVINIESRPQVAQTLGVRTVPWLQIGPFELEGLHSPAELKRWAEQTDSLEGMADYFAERFRTGQLSKVTEYIRRNADYLDALLLSLADPDTELQVRIGIGAVMEEFEGESRLKRIIPRLAELVTHKDKRIRSDACHYLALTHNSDAAPHIRGLLNDPDEAVREIARESLELINRP